MTDNFVKKYLSYVIKLCEFNDHIGFFSPIDQIIDYR